jgi:hypothetical protein
MGDADLDRCWATLRPLASEVARFAKTAPLTAEKSRVLAVYLAAHFFGGACGAMKGDEKLRHLTDSEVAEQVARLIVDMMRKEEMQ